MAGRKTKHEGVRYLGPRRYLVRATMRHPETKKLVQRELTLENVTMEEAVEERARLRQGLRRVLLAPAAPVAPARQSQGGETLSAFVKRWLPHVEAVGRRRSHVVDDDLRKLEQFILPYLGHRYVHEFTRRDIADWTVWLSTLRKPDGKPYARDTVKSSYRLLRTMLRDARVLADLEQDPFDGMRMPKIGPANVRVKDTLTREELLRLLTAALGDENPVARAMVWVLATTGMRFGELAALTWADIYFDRGVIHIQASAVQGKRYATKTETERMVPLLPGVSTLLEAHMAWLVEQLNPNPHSLVFPTRAGEYRTSGMMRKVYTRLAKNAEPPLKKVVTNQCLRRTVNNLMRQVAGEIAARAITGHTTQAMTEHYSDVTADEKREAVARALTS